MVKGGVSVLECKKSVFVCGEEMKGDRWWVHFSYIEFVAWYDS